MPLSDGYGVLIGTIESYKRDDPDNYGRYYHENLVVRAPAGLYRCAIDVDSHQSNTGVEWRVVPISEGSLSSVLSLGQGLHTLASNSTSGAVDYIRSSMMVDSITIGCNPLSRAIKAILPLRFTLRFPWKQGTSLQALEDLEPLLDRTRSQGLQVLVYGEPFMNGLGVHNIHQNQGDPLGTSWSAENGIWQDGCTVLHQGGSLYMAFLNKFTSQSYLTDDNGHPV